MKPATKLNSIPRESADDRIQFCRKMLYFHDFLTPAENAKVQRRIAKWLKEHGQEENVND